MLRSFQLQNAFLNGYSVSLFDVKHSWKSTSQKETIEGKGRFIMGEGTIFVQGASIYCLKIVSLIGLHKHGEKITRQTTRTGAANVQTRLLEKETQQLWK